MSFRFNMEFYAVFNRPNGILCHIYLFSTVAFAESRYEGNANGMGSRQRVFYHYEMQEEENGL
jgi:hypothetical protein